MPNSERIEISIRDTDAFLAVVERVKHLESINDRVAQLELLVRNLVIRRAGTGAANGNDRCWIAAHSQELLSHEWELIESCEVAE